MATRGAGAPGDAILGRVMLAFEGEVLPARIAERLTAAPAAGMSLFRFHNVRSPGQVLELTSAFQRAGAAAPHAAPADPSGSSPMLVAADQEGGQFIGLGEGSTAFAGNMALGAVDDVGLTERVGHAIGTEARAMGVNVVYAPVLDLATDPANPALGIRSFGDSPEAVGSHGAAMVRGLQAAGVAATVKHAPGMGHISSDTHHGLAVASAERSVLEAREFVPFRAAFAAGARLAMSGHMALPAVTGRDDLPGTLSRAVMTDLLRRDLGLRGRDDLRRARHAGARPGPGPGPRRRSRRSGPASTCCWRRPTPRRWPASRRRSSVPWPGSCSIRPRWPPRNVVWPRSGRGWARSGRHPICRSSGAPSTRPSLPSWPRAPSRSSATRAGSCR